MLFFKRLEIVIKRLYAEKKQETDSDSLALLNDKLDLLLEISEFIKSGKWLNRQSATDRLLYCLKHSVSESAEHFGCSTFSINSSMTNYSRKIEALLGDNILELIAEGRLSEAKLQFYWGTGQVSTNKLFFADFIDMLPSAKYEGDVDILDCGVELKFLKVCSIAYIKSLFAKIDKEKLAYLRYVLEKDSADTVQERMALFNFLNDDEISITDLKKELLSIKAEKG